MSYCINPQCPSPADGIEDSDRVCPHCGSDLILQNRYRILGLLGSGGFGKTFEAADGKQLKVIKVLYKNHPKAVSLFQQEAKVLSRLSHPGIPKVEADGYFTYTPPDVEEPIHCLVMEKIEGLNLIEWLERRRNQPIDKKQTVEWLEQLVEILEQVHQQHYFHRDIKPHNIMRRPNGQLVLIDFGTAREVTGTYLNKVGGGQNVTEIISAGYSPPEQINGKAVPQSDFYALGRTFVYLMTGKKPTEFPEHPRTGKLQWREGAPHIPDALADVIDYMMAPFPGNRPQHAQMILTSLAEAEPAIASAKAPPTISLQRKSASSAPHSSPPRSSRLRSGNSGTPKGGTESRATGSAFRPSQVNISHLKQPLRRLPQFKIGWKPLAAIAAGLLAVGQAYGYWRYGWFPANPLQLVTAFPSASSLEAVLSRKAGKVQAFALSADGNLLVSGSFGQLRFIAVRNGVLLQTRSPHETWVNDIVFTANGGTLISASDDGTIRIWDVRTGIRKLTLSGHGAAVNDIALSPDESTLVSASDDGTVRVWDLPQGRLRYTLRGHGGPVNALALAQDGTTLISGGDDKALRVWNVRQGVQIRSITGHEGAVRAVALSPDGKTIASAGQDERVRLWNVFPGASLDRLQDNQVSAASLVFTPDGRQLLAGGDAIYLWNVETGDRSAVLRGHAGEIRALALTPEGDRVISGGLDRTIKLWELPTESP